MPPINPPGHSIIITITTTGGGGEPVVTTLNFTYGAADDAGVRMLSYSLNGADNVLIGNFVGAAAFAEALASIAAGVVGNAEIDARIKPFAQTGSATPPLPQDLAPDPAAGRVLGTRTMGGQLLMSWNEISNQGFFIARLTRPTPTQIAIGGLAPSGGHVLVTPADGPEEIWVRYFAASPLVKVATFADHIVRPGADGHLPDAASNAGRIGIAGSLLYRSVGEQGHDKAVGFADYGPTRPTPPSRSAQELLYGGSFANPPHSTINNYVTNTILWDRGSEVWIIKATSNADRWSTYSGPLGYHTGRLYQTDADAAVHVANATEIGDIYIIGAGANQRPRLVRTFTAPTAPSAEWIPIGLTIQDLAAAVADHNASNAAHADIRALIAAAGDPTAAIAAAVTTHNANANAHASIRNNIPGVSDINSLANARIAVHNASNAAHNDLRTLISALQAASGVTITAYNAGSTYSRGSSNSIVTHADGLFIYISGTERSANHDPGLQPGYWLRLSEGVAYEVISSGSHRIAARTIIVNGDNDNVYLCTTTQTTPRDLAYIHAQAQAVGGAFIHLNPPTVLADGSITKAKLDAALAEEIDIVEVNPYNPTGVTYHAGSSIIRVGTAMYQCRAGYTSSTFDNRGPTGSAGATYWDELLAIREVNDDPGAGVAGIMFVW